jgi:hypothetical protein
MEIGEGAAVGRRGGVEARGRPQGGVEARGRRRWFESGWGWRGRAGLRSTEWAAVSSGAHTLSGGGAIERW